MDISNYIDFKLEFNKDNIKILQITDMQPVDPSQQRFKGRLDYFPFNTPFTDKMKYDNEFYYIDKAICDTKPDLIIITGDIVYGEFDDNGKNLIEFCNFMDKYKIPWAPIFGNHDNETKLGVTWQCNQFLNSKYCLFKRNNLTGNGNYNIGIYNNNQLIRVIYMIDSNGVWQGKKYAYIDDYPLYNVDEHITKEGRIFEDQQKYIQDSSNQIDKLNNKIIKKTLCTHIPPDFIDKYVSLKGYDKDGILFDLGGTCLVDNKDFGKIGEKISSFPSNGLYELLKECNFDTIFVAHDHVNTLSIDCDGLRASFGIKTSTFDYHDKVGSLLFEINDDNYKIIHQFIDKI